MTEIEYCDTCLGLTRHRWTYDVDNEDTPFELICCRCANEDDEMFTLVPSVVVSPSKEYEKFYETLIKFTQEAKNGK